jgi:hypothetical protein
MFLNQVVAIRNIFITSEAEEMVADATAKGGELDFIWSRSHEDISYRMHP